MRQLVIRFDLILMRCYSIGIGCVCECSLISFDYIAQNEDGPIPSTRDVSFAHDLMLVSNCYCFSAANKCIHVRVCGHAMSLFADDIELICNSIISCVCAQ